MERLILDHIDEIIYLSDMKSYEILFLNEAGKKAFNTKNYEGKKCYELIQGKDSPCEFCQKDKLDREKQHYWSMLEKDKRWTYTLKDKWVKKEKRQLKLTIGIDNSELIKKEKVLKRLVSIEELQKNSMKLLAEEEKEEKVLEQLGLFVGATSAHIYIKNMNDKSNIHSWYAYGVQPIEKDEAVDLLNYTKAFEGEILTIDPVENIKQNYEKEYKNLQTRGVSSLIIAPIRIRGKKSGVVYIENPIHKEDSYTILKTVAMIVGMYYEKKQYYKQIENLINRDSLTGVKNRNCFTTYKEQLELQQIKQLGMVFIDVNSLKEANDTMGYTYGDRILKEVAYVLTTIWGEEEVYRLGGDEFIIIDSIRDEISFNACVAKTKHLIQQDTNATVALGSEWKCGKIEVEQMLVDVDMAMYKNKRKDYLSRKTPIRFRYETPSESYSRHYNALVEAIEKNELKVLYQPKVNIHSKKMVGVESLIRWVKSDETLIMPDEFIPIYEKNGLIDRIDFYMINSAVEQLQEWLSQEKEMIPIAVNICKTTLLSKDFLERLLEIPSIQQMSKWIELEITERDIPIEDIEKIAQVVDQLRERQFSIAIDDFGTGSSNLLLLTSLNISTLKIDKSMLNHIKENKKVARILQNIIKTCEELAIEIVVEGVEDLEQLSILQSIGNKVSQGYYFSRPVEENRLKYSYD